MYAIRSYYDLKIGIAALELMRSQLDTLHSRKLRSFDEPPFR